nr:hypothetical protein Ahy_A10g047660 [Ipomoea batatas]
MCSSLCPSPVPIIPSPGNPSSMSSRPSVVRRSSGEGSHGTASEPMEAVPHSAASASKSWLSTVAVSESSSTATGVLAVTAPCPLRSAAAAPEQLAVNGAADSATSPEGSESPASTPVSQSIAAHEPKPPASQSVAASEPEPPASHDGASSPPPNAFSIAKATSSLFTWAPVSSSIPNITGNSTPAFTPVLSTFTTNLSFKNCSANNGQVINGKPEAIPSRVEFHPQCDRLPRQTKRTERNWANGPNWFPLLFPQLFDVFWFQLLKAVYQYPISIILCIFHLFVKLLKFLGHRIKDVFELSFGEFNLIRQSRHFKVLGFRLHAFKITPAP